MGLLEDGTGAGAAAAGGGAAKATKDSSKMVSLEDFDLIRVIGRGSYAKVIAYFDHLSTNKTTLSFRS